MSRWHLSLIFSFLLVFFFGMIYQVSFQPKNTKGVHSQVTVQETPPLFFEEDLTLRNMLEEQLKGQKGEFAIVILDQSGQKGVAINAWEKFPSGSFYKLPLMALVLEAIKRGWLDADTGITAQTQDLIERYGALDFGYEGVGPQVSYTVEQALIRVATVSDNFASLMLLDKIRSLNQLQNLQKDPLEEITQRLGMHQTFYQPQPTTTAYDIALFFKLLAQEKLISKDISLKLTQLLTQSRINDRIPAKLPDGLMIAHKTAELPFIRHDAGIVYYDPQDASKYYILVLMSKNLAFEDEGVETLANLSNLIYRYFAK